MRELYQKGVRGFGQEALGKMFGVHRLTIRKVVRGATWKFL